MSQDEVLLPDRQSVSDVYIAAPRFTDGASLGALEVALGLADDEFVIAHRHSEWLGLHPFLEGDLVMASISQDELGHARGLYGLLWPTWDDRDALVVRRPPDEWRSCELVELGGLAWEEAFIRHVIYDVCEPHRWRALQTMWRTPEIHGLCERVLAEEGFHLRHAVDLLRRLSRGGQEAQGRLQVALDRLWPLATELLNGLEPIDRDIAFSNLHSVFVENGLSVIVIGPAQPKTRAQRSVDFAQISQMLVDVIAFDPTARW